MKRTIESGHHPHTMTEVRATPRARGGAGHVYLIGIGGAGMRALASVLASRGWRVSGSDASVQRCGELSGASWQVASFHDPTNVPIDADVAVFSDAVPPDHPERLRAAALGIATYSYAQMLGRLLNAPGQIAIAGTHGKSTTTAIAAELLIAGGFDPTVVCGASPVAGQLGAYGGRDGSGPLDLVEACEYRDHFLYLRPDLAVLGAVEPDHFDYFPSNDQMLASFNRFVELLPADGMLLVAGQCETAQTVARVANCPAETFGLLPGMDWSGELVFDQHKIASMRIRHRTKTVGTFEMSMSGRHNLVNALAAVAVAKLAGATNDNIREGLDKFTGLHRRMEYLGNHADVEVWDDYAHHPTHVACVLDTLRRHYQHSRILCVFQPHQASRTARLMDQFAESLRHADLVAVADISRAREGPWRHGDVTAADLARGARQHGTKVLSDHSQDSILQCIKLACCPGDVLVTLGAGDIWKLSHAFANRF